MGKKSFIQVILPLKLDWAPFYSVDQDFLWECFPSHPALFLTQDSGNQSDGADGAEGLQLRPGVRVRVTFARKPYTGIVIRSQANPPENISRILPVNEIATDLEMISLEELKLWKFLSEYYLCTLGEVYRTAYPIRKIRQEQVAARALERETVRQQKDKEKLEAKIQRLEDRRARKAVALETARKESRRLLLQDELRDLEIQVGKARQELEWHLQTAVPLPEPEQEQDAAGQGIILSDAQQTAYDEIRQAFHEQKIVLLNGVTGSGKTEIYINLARETLAKGRNVLYLVPEILLNNQLASRLGALFGDRLLSFNSQLGTAERYRIAEKVKSRSYVVLGTRSALFLPHHNLGLIIVDEEHDTSYKQQDFNPRYNGRDTAIVLAQIFNSQVILGSATPSLESLYNCANGRYREVALREKYYEGEGAEVQLIDTLAERKKNGMKGLFSFQLIAQIRDTLAEGGQVLILRSRRAWSPVVQCTGCGDIPHCPHCNVSLSYHKSTGRLLCHYCGWSMPYSQQCSHCGGTYEPLGSGTQKVEEEARQLFPGYAIARLDSDTAASRSYLQATMEGFYKGDIQVLVGTQIVTKGLDFPNLSLVVMLQADAMLGIEDFRADERALQLLEQFRGRCARRHQKGKFIIQTSQPQHPIYRQMTGQGGPDQNIIGHFLEERKQFHYPPYTRSVTLVVRDVQENRLQYLSGQLYRQLLQGFGKTESAPALQLDLPWAQPDGNVQIMPPAAPVIDKVSDEFIRLLRLSFKRDGQLAREKKKLLALIRQFEEEKRYAGHIIIDVDPI